MNNLIIPPSANWYETSILACTPDNTLIYGARNDIVILYDSPDEQPSDVRIIHRAHSQKIISTNINRNWGQPYKLLVTAAEDNIVKLWDIETKKKKFGHNGHVGQGKVIGATFAGDDRVISVSEDGVIIVWNINQNQTNVLKDVLGSKVIITCISTCPHANFLTAFGLRNGLVVVTDLRKQGKVLYKLRGHDKSVLSLSWCPAPVNIFPKDPHNYVGMKSVDGNVTAASPEKKDMLSSESNTEQILETKPEESAEPVKLAPDIENVVHKKVNKRNIWSNLKHADDDELGTSTEDNSRAVLEDVSTDDDFLKECQNLKNAIMGRVATETANEKCEKENYRVIIKAKRKQDKPTEEQQKNLTDNAEFSTSTKNEIEGINVLEMDKSTSKIEDDTLLTKKDSEVEKSKYGTNEEITTKDLEELKRKIEVDVLPIKKDAKDEKLRAETHDKIAKEDSSELQRKTEVDNSPSKNDAEDEKPKAKTNKGITKEESDQLKKKNEGDILPTQENAENENPKDDANEEFAKGDLDELKRKNKVDNLPTTENAEEEKNVEEPLKDNIKKTSFGNTGSPGSDFKKVDGEAVEETNGDKIDEAIVVEHNNTTCGEAKREIPINVPVEEEPRREFLLASSGKEGNIYIWRAGTDGRMQTFLTVPNKTGQRRSGKSSSDKLWIALCWISPTILLSSSKSAELMKWTLPKPKSKNKQYSVLHCDHNSMLFSIAAPIVFLNEHNWLDERKSNVWTFGHDRLLLNTSLNSERTNLACYPTLGNAECLSLSPVDPNRLAIGAAEGVIKVWDLSRPNIKNIVMTSFFQKIQSKVVALAWHPINELILAFGTSEGRVGLLDTNNKSKAPTVLLNYFKSQIHKIEWGPVNGDREDLGLFAVAEGKLVLYSVKKSGKAPVEVNTPDDLFVYTFGWKPDYTMLLVGTKSGVVILYSPELKILSTHYFQHRLKDIYWHPDAAQSDPTVSERCYWFASISNSKEVIVCNFQKDVEDGAKVVAKYEYCDDVINFISWNPYASNELVIASDEGTAQVWNVENNMIVSTYTSPNFEGILSAIWSPIDSDCIISAIKDHTIRVWRISEHPQQDNKEIKELRKKAMKQITKEQTDLLPKAEKTQEQPLKSKVTKVNLLPTFFYPKNAPQIIDDLKKLFLWKQGSYNIEMGGGDNNCDILKVFGSKSDMLDIIEQNEIVHQEKGKFGFSNTLSLFKGDIGIKIKKAIDERRVNPWIIAIAPMVSHKLWQLACETYAQQLTETADSDPIQIATYYLACHKVEEAINALCDSEMYREALALAKCRLPEDSSTITQILEKWAKYSVVVGNFEAAAQCYICLEKYEDAASVLFRRSDIKTLKFAVELAEKSGNEELHKAILFKYNTCKDENDSEEKQLPSKLDAVLQQHLENKRNDSSEKCSSGENLIEVESEVKVSLGNDQIEKEVLNEETSENAVAPAEISDINEQICE